MALLACAPALPEERLPQPPVDAPPPETPVRPVAAATVGVILPQGGSELLREYGSLVLDGIRLALPPGGEIDLAIVDDGGTPARSAALVADLERRGVVAIIGPLLSEATIEAARARTTSDLVILSPTASDPPRAANAYSLNAPDLEGARALGRYAAQNGMTRVALLYPGMPDFTAAVVAFREAHAAAGGRIVADVAYRTGTTTFADQMRTIRNANAHAVYIAASERDIRQIAPQVEFYGIGAARVLGSEAWTTDEIVRVLPSRQTDGVIAATALLPASRDVAWGEFVGRYEAAHRRTLDNPYPALGYDAMRMIVQALEGGRARRGDVASRIASLREFRGATGVISIRDGALVRRPFLVRIEGGRLVQITGAR